MVALSPTLSVFGLAPGCVYPSIVMEKPTQTTVLLRSILCTPGPSIAKTIWLGAGAELESLTAGARDAGPVESAFNTVKTELRRTVEKKHSARNAARIKLRGQLTTFVMRPPRAEASFSYANIWQNPARNREKGGLLASGDKVPTWIERSAPRFVLRLERLFRARSTCALLPPI